MKTIHTHIIIALTLAFYSCSSEDPEPTFETDLKAITTHTEGGLSVTLYASEAFFVGYNSITAKVADQNGGPVGGDISVTPVMDMGTMTHACPLEMPVNSLSDGKVSFHPVFVMPSGDMGNWSLDFTINGTDISVPVTVSSPDQARMVSFTSATDSVSYFVALIAPVQPQVGQNDLEIAVYKKQSMIEWPPVTGLTVGLEPWMVSMDHGSPNNVAPTHTGNGHYSGTVNFTMTGDWQVRFTITENGGVIGTPYVELNFQ